MENLQAEFNRLIKDISLACEATGNIALKKVIKKRLFDFSDYVLKKEETRNEQNNKQS